MDDKRKTAMDRRGFFGTVAGVSTAAAAAAVMFSPTEARAYDPGATEMKARYRETEHVKTFYRVNGYQTLKK